MALDGKRALGRKMVDLAAAFRAYRSVPSFNPKPMVFVGDESIRAAMQWWLAEVAEQAKNKADPNLPNDVGTRQ
jgi:hypothetical protein